jgi:RND family efflux transporter MFP subunit
MSTIFSPLSQHKVILELQPNWHLDESSLQAIRIKSPSTGQQIPLGSIARLDPSFTPLAINHLGPFPAVTLSFNLALGAFLSDAVTAIQKVEAEIKKPNSIIASFRGSAQAFQDSVSSQPILIIAAILVVYIILGVLYESFIHPITILSSLPSATFGALLAMWLFQYDLSVITLIGLILLVGIVKKNAIMMVDVYAQKVLERDTGLFDKKIIDRQSLDLQQATTAQLEALVKANEAAVANAKVQLEFTKITAPIDGRVGLRLVDKGNIVHANDQAGLAVITQLQPISVVFTLPEGNLREITKGLKTNGADESLAVAALDPQDNQVLGQGELRAMDNQVDEATGTIKLKAVFQNRQFELWPGQFVNIHLLVDTRRQQLVVPSSAVNQGPSGEFIYIIRPDLIAEVRAVKVGISEDGSTVIENGISEGEDVVVYGQYLLKANARVVLKK